MSRPQDQRHRRQDHSGAQPAAPGARQTGPAAAQRRPLLHQWQPPAQHHLQLLGYWLHSRWQAGPHVRGGQLYHAPGAAAATPTHLAAAAAAATVSTQDIGTAAAAAQAQHSTGRPCRRAAWRQASTETQGHAAIGAVDLKGPSCSTHPWPQSLPPSFALLFLQRSPYRFFLPQFLPPFPWNNNSVLHAPHQLVPLDCLAPILSCFPHLIIALQKHT